jgi:hypothetical protein
MVKGAMALPKPKKEIYMDFLGPNPSFHPPPKNSNIYIYMGSLAPKKFTHFF